MKKLGRFGGFWHAMVHYHCLLPSFPKSLILKELNWWLGSLGEKEMRGKKIQSSMLPSVSVTFAGSSAGQSTALVALVQTAVSGSWGCDDPRGEPWAHTAVCGTLPAPESHAFLTQKPGTLLTWVINSFNPSQPAEMAQPQNLTDAKRVSTWQLFCIQFCVIKRSTSKF